MVSRGSKIADIGCDHGYVSIYLVEQGICPGALAMDVRPGPLACAQRNVQAHRLSDKITLRLSDGMKELVPGEAEEVVIAGMGGLLMIRILSDGMASGVMDSVRALILQPQSELYDFRKFLAENGYKIQTEKMICEDGKYYPMMRVERGTEIYTDEMSLTYGGHLIREKDPVLLRFLEKEEARIEQVAEQLRCGEGERIQKRLEELEKERAVCKGALSMMTDPEGLSTV